MVTLMEPMKLSDKEFDKIVKKAVQLIPREISLHLDNMVISVRKRPSKSMMREMGMSPDTILLGAYQGVPLVGRSVTSPPLFPDTILLFQEPLQEMCDTQEELEKQIGITVMHEIAHFVGIDEERLRELGCG